MIFIDTLWRLVCLHALCDYPLQGDFLSKLKNHTAPIPGVHWLHGLVPHALIHGGAVTFVTGSTGLGMCEAVAHCLIDHLKCDGRLSYDSDQVLHIFCKVVWAVAVGCI